VGLATERVPITQVLSKLGVWVGESRSGKQKVYCPFGEVYHPDHGQKKSMLIYYDSNTCYCFAGCGHFSAVKLWAFANDLSLEQAAIQMLDWIGHAPKSVDERIEQAQQEKFDPQPEMLALALKRFCYRVDPGFEIHQTDPDVARKLAVCLDLLETVHSKEDVTKWLEATKTAMSKILKEKFHERDSSTR